MRRRGPFREEAFRSSLHDERIAAILGAALGVSFSVCFVTGLLSHLIQHPPSWFEWPSRPAGLYRVTQGVHVATGIAAIPLLLAKLWVVYPQLWTWPPVRSFSHLVERVSLLPLVGGSLFLLVSGVGNIDRWRPYEFAFLESHYRAAWITVGALVVHVAAKWPTTARSLRRDRATPLAAPGALSRRGFLGTIAGTAVLLTVTTVGQTVRPLQRLAVLAPRRPGVGPQGFPVNGSASGAGVIAAATDPRWQLVVAGPARTLRLTRDDLLALPQHEVDLPIACVQGWSAMARWRGVRVRDLAAMVGGGRGSTARAVSLQARSPYRTSELNADHVHDRDTVLALWVNGAPLHLDHGFPCRLVGPNRPGVHQTKWLARLEVTA